jgi:hypothetical protein
MDEIVVELDQRHLIQNWMDESVVVVICVLEDQEVILGEVGNRYMVVSHLHVLAIHRETDGLCYHLGCFLLPQIAN